MNGFQIIICALLPLLLAGSIVAARRKWFTRAACFLWCAVWVAAAAAVIWPEITSAIANVLGIGRGADLVSYGGIVAMLVGFWTLYVRLYRLRREITLLVRKLAILEARREYDLGTRASGPRICQD